MTLRFALVAFALLAAGSLAHAQGRPSLDCSKFKHNANGSWSPLAPATITGPDGSTQIGPGAAVNHGEDYAGTDVAAELNAKCR